jgi:predicted RNA-binding protein with PUA-like domain
MNYWLLKTDPEAYSYTDLEKEKKTVWDRVSNPLALKYLRQIKKGDLAVIYHTGKEKAVVGVAQAVGNPFADPKHKNEKLVVLEVKPKHRLTFPVTLAEIKSCKYMSDFLLVRMPRLSVMPVTHKQWEFLVPSNPLED